MRDLSDAVLWRDTKPEAEDEADKLRAAARRLGYQVVVRGSQRRYGTRVYTDPPYGVFLEPLKS
jgi:TolB-like protein